MIPPRPEERQRRLDGRGAAREDERRRERGEGPRDVPGRLAVAAPHDPLEDERGDEAREDGGEADRPLVRAEGLHHHREDRREEDRHPARVAERRRREREELGEPSLHDVAGARPPRPLRRGRRDRASRAEPAGGGGPRRGPGRTGGARRPPGRPPSRSRTSRRRSIRPGSSALRRSGAGGERREARPERLARRVVGEVEEDGRDREVSRVPVEERRERRREALGERPVADGAPAGELVARRARRRGPARRRRRDGPRARGGSRSTDGRLRPSRCSSRRRSTSRKRSEARPACVRTSTSVSGRSTAPAAGDRLAVPFDDVAEARPRHPDVEPLRRARPVGGGREEAELGGARRVGGAEASAPRRGGPSRARGRRRGPPPAPRGRPARPAVAARERALGGEERRPPADEEPERLDGGRLRAPRAARAARGGRRAPRRRGSRRAHSIASSVGGRCASAVTRRRLDAHRRRDAGAAVAARSRRRRGASAAARPGVARGRRGARTARR